MFLIGQGFHPGVADGEFGKATETATIEFQKHHSLDPDGAVGNQTLGAAMLLGFEMVTDDDPSPGGANFPPPPAFPPLVSNAERQRIFGKFAFIHKPLPANPENIVITGNWQRDNIVMVSIPQLAGVPGAPSDGRIAFHKLGANQLAALWTGWQRAKLLNRVLEWGGSFVPRFVRGSTTQLSNHSFGSAFDINMQFNRLSAEPARLGQKGCVRELVAIANDNGFYWGGHFTRRDGMHFEIAKILP
jgi:hypothetical protein